MSLHSLEGQRNSSASMSAGLIRDVRYDASLCLSDDSVCPYTTMADTWQSILRGPSYSTPGLLADVAGWIVMPACEGEQFATNRCY